jgi:hypothetical protein
MIVPVPKSGASSRPPRKAPTMPTTTLRMMPCWSLVFMTMLASQPRMPPTMTQRMKDIPCSIRTARNGTLRDRCRRSRKRNADVTRKRQPRLQ